MTLQTRSLKCAKVQAGHYCQQCRGDAILQS